MGNLIIFDIDGTLIHYIECEDKAYLESINEVAGIDEICTKWDEYSYSTESGILTEIFYRALKRPPSDEELRSIRKKYVSSLLNGGPQAISCIPGAKTVFDVTKGLGFDVAIATGAWHDSALVKLNGAQISHAHIPMANGDSHFERAEIIKNAVSLAKKVYQKETYQNIIYVGDRLWDLKATQALEIGFIGVGAHLKSLARSDFFHVDDFTTPSFLEHLKKHTHLSQNMMI
jgi:phosphoglycolate phosphatase-like HAD superfamily hydrolase